MNTNPKHHSEEKAQQSVSIEESIENINGEFTQPALRLLGVTIAAYINDLIQSAYTLSRRQGADVVSKTHVKIASQYLAPPRARKLYRLLGTLGGIFFGACLSSLLSNIDEINAGEIGPNQIIAMLVLG